MTLVQVEETPEAAEGLETVTSQLFSTGMTQGLHSY